MSTPAWIGVAALGGTGAILRLVVDLLISSAADLDFPIGTFTINITGSFLLGLVSGLAFTGDAIILAGTATLGSYTTFSTWMLESHRLREDGQFMESFANIAISLIVGLAAVTLGRAIGIHL